jgi:hypothetical protein
VVEHLVLVMVGELRWMSGDLGTDEPSLDVDGGMERTFGLELLVVLKMALLYRAGASDVVLLVGLELLLLVY